MLEALLHKAKLTQNKVDKIKGFNSYILENIGIDPQQIFSKQAEEKRIDTESRILFKVLLELNQPIGKTCTELEEAAKEFGKNQRIPPPQLKDWAGQISSRNPEKRIRKWAYAAAIDVLQQHGI